jgi:hypothetical protein
MRGKNGMNRLFIIAGLIILVVALVFLGQGVKNSGLPDDDDDHQQAPPAQAAPAQAPAKQTPGASGAPSPPLPAEQTLGNPATAKHHITVGWVYTDANQHNPQSLTVPIQAVRDYVQKSGGTVSAQIVNVDVPAEDRSPAAKSVAGSGIYVDGKPLIPGDVSRIPPQAIAGALASTAK